MDFDPEATMCAGNTSRGGWVALDPSEATHVSAVGGATEDVDDILYSGEEIDGGELEMLCDELVGTILGSYRLLDLLGEGGMGKVYLAEHVKIGRKVAIKLLRAQYARRPEIVAQFFYEARSVNQIRHENIIDVTDFVEDQGGHSYLVMELLSGVEFGALVRGSSPLPLERVLHIFIQITDGLAGAHDVGIVHRDLKPDNVFLVHRGADPDFVKLLDFGVAKMLGDAMGDYGHGRIIGTPAYMSPEQAAGGAFVDNRSDVYAVGVMLYRICTGKTPFRARKIEDYVRLHCEEPPVPPNEVLGLAARIPDRLEALILRCLAKRPDDRFQTMAELGAELRALQEEMFVPKAAPSPVAPPLRRSRIPLWTAAASALAGGVGVMIFLLQRNQTEEARAEAPVAVVAAASAPDRAPATVAAAAPEAPANVRLDFTSSPGSAGVWRASDTTGLPLGVTPFSLPLLPENRDEAFVFKLRGHLPVTVSASLRANGSVEVSLTRAADPVSRGPAEAPKPAPSPKAKKFDVSDRLDPFAGDGR